MNRFLIVRLGSLGDVIHGIPAAAALRARYPDARIDWVTDPRYLELVALVSGVDGRVPIDTRRVSRTLSVLGELRRVRYDAAIDLQGLLKSAVLARGAGARRTIGFPAAHLREPMARAFYTETPDPGPAAHVILKNLALLAPLGVEGQRIAFPLDIPPSAVAGQIAAAAGTEGYALINPGAAWPNKRWPPARFGSLATALRDRFNVRSVVVWGPGEEALASAVVAASTGAATMAPATSMADLFSVARGARLVVSGDTGPLHIAAAVGAPIVALFGPTFPHRNGPWSAADVSLSRDAACDCHYERECRRRERCIDEITVNEVLAAAERRLTLASPAPADRGGTDA